MNFTDDLTAIGNAIAIHAPVKYRTFEDEQSKGVTNAESLYIALTDVALEYENDSAFYPDVTCTYTIDVYVKGLITDAETRCLEIAGLCVGTLIATRIGPSPVRVTSVKRSEKETQSTCRYTMTAEIKFTEVIDGENI